MEPKKNKRIIICCDGTWQDLTNPNPSNVVKLTQAIKPVDSNGIQQVVFYDPGIGIEELRLLGGATGAGIDKNIEDCYRFLAFNYVEGDEIYMFGFSRGAYTVRSLCGMIYCSGLLQSCYITKTHDAYQLYRDRGIKPSGEEAVNFRKKYCANRVKITLLGCFDTVAALGIPLVFPFNIFNATIHEKYNFHDTVLNRDIQNALHAMAIDEIREVFDVTPMTQCCDVETQRVIQKWFPGEHGCVGGGTYEYLGLSDGALKWMIDSINHELKLGLEFDINNIVHIVTSPDGKPEVHQRGIKPNHLCEFDNNPGFYLLAGIKHRQVGDKVEDFHESAINRLKKRKDYRPRNLAKIIPQVLS